MLSNIVDMDLDAIDESIIIPTTEVAGVNKEGWLVSLKKKPMPGYIYFNLELTDKLKQLLQEHTTNKSLYPTKFQKQKLSKI